MMVQSLEINNQIILNTLIYSMICKLRLVKQAYLTTQKFQQNPLKTLHHITCQGYWTAIVQLTPHTGCLTFGNGMIIQHFQF